MRDKLNSCMFVLINTTLGGIILVGLALLGALGYAVFGWAGMIPVVIILLLLIFIIVYLATL
jgi:hypothetical protein